MMLPTRYKVIGAPLDGGMGSVIPCEDQILERRVAIKVIHGTTNRRRMQDELSALLKMRSKHVVQVYDLLQLENDSFGIVQEFVDGKDLFNVSRPTATVDLYKQLWQIASGISDIHALNVIHRDIKPNNMKIDSEGVIKIFDFGLARDEGPSAATVGFVGTPGFAAPELYAGIVQFTPAVDTYAFGATALYLTTGNLPEELMKRPPEPPKGNYFTAAQMGLAPEITSILQQCLAPSPVDRPRMEQVRDLISRHVLYDLHLALVVFKGKESYLNAQNRSVNLSLPSMGQINICYDGLDFRVESVSGDVFVNNKRIAVHDCLPGSCVVTLGAPEQANHRRYVTFDLSHPEFVL